MFCKKCGGLLVPVERDGKKVFVCNSCDEISDENVELSSTKVESKEKIRMVSEGEDKVLPRMEARCGKCGNNEAYFWVVQTRGLDEPPTKFFRCTKCSHTWRRYD